MDTRSLEYSDYVADSESWFFVAEDLMSCAKALEPEVRRYWKVEDERSLQRKASKGILVWARNSDPRSVHFMLLAYAIENLCKGLLVALQPERLRSQAAENEKLPGELFGHRLDKLLRRIEFLLEDGDLEVAKRLERCSVWSARYPVPIGADVSFSYETPDGEVVNPIWHERNDLEVVNAFVARVNSFVQERLVKSYGLPDIVRKEESDV